MQYLTIKNLYFKYKQSSMPIFQDLSLEFEQGWSCIVGANGSGKSTLLKLISKEYKAQGGSIKGNDLSYYCAQSTENMPDDLEDFMLTYTGKAFKIRDLLEIKDSWVYSWETLSHGERKRLQLALALFGEPDVLLIDEPTNHLDMRSKDIVIEALKSFKGIGILVSHDRKLLDTLARVTIIVKNQETISYKTSYSNAIDEHYKNLEHLKNNNLKQNRELKKLKKSIQSQHEKVSQSKKRMSKKTLKKGDSDAKGKIDMARFTGKDKNDGRLVAKLQAKEKKILDSSVKTDKTYSVGITVNATRNRNIFPLVIKKSILKMSEDKILSYPLLTINQHTKVGIVGDNGSGKSSFIESLISTMDLKEEYLYIPQEISQEEGKKLFDDINELPNEIKGEIYTIIRRLSSDPIKLQDSFSPSPGEIRKLIIAQGLLQNPSLIILDEPTNHMDLDSIISLELALQEYNGAMIIISHDQAFLDAIVTDLWSFTKERENHYITEDEHITHKEHFSIASSCF